MTDWTPQQDSLLAEAMAVHGDKWVEIKKVLGNDKKVGQVRVFGVIL